MEFMDLEGQELNALVREQQISDAAWEDTRGDFTVAAIEIAATLGDSALLAKIIADRTPSGWVRPEYYQAIANRSPEAAATVLQRMHEIGAERRAKELEDVSLLRGVWNVVTGKGPRLGL